jgi:hypothetical protein
MTLIESPVIIFCGGVNDLGINNSQMALRQITDFIQINNYTNIIILSVPQCHDFMDSSCVSSEIRTLNRKLMKLVKTSEHTTLLEINQDSKCFTSHGLHLHRTGKQMLAIQIAFHIYTILRK